MTDEQNKRLEQKIDRIDERLITIDVTLARQAVTLEEHVRRSNAIETRVEQVASQIVPVERHVAAVNGVLRFIGICGTLVGILGGLAKLFKIF